MMVANCMDMAIKSFETALEINPTHYRAKSKLAICLYETGKNKEALEVIISTEKLDVETLGLHYQTSILYCDKKRFATAMSNMDAVFKANFAGADSFSNVEVVLENIGLVDRAVATWDRLTETARAAISERYQ